MNLERKKSLAVRTLDVGRARIFFVPERIEEIKQAITKQDIRDLVKDGAIIIRPISGRKTIVRRKRRRGPGSIKKVVNNSKRDYIIITRKCRAYIQSLKVNKKISKEHYITLRKKIRMSSFSSLSQCKEYLRSLSE